MTTPRRTTAGDFYDALALDEPDPDLAAIAARLDTTPLIEGDLHCG